MTFNQGNVRANSVTESPTNHPNTTRAELEKLPLAALQAKLATSPQGLTQEEAQRRLAQYGYNELAEKEGSRAAEAAALFLGADSVDDRSGGGAVGGGTALGGLRDHHAAAVGEHGGWVLGGISGGECDRGAEGEAGGAARVLRDGKWLTPAARELVPGDVIRVRLGDIVPADARLLEGDPVEVDQSALTGESLPVSARRGRRSTPGRSCGRGKAWRWCTGRGGTRTLGRRRSW